MNDFTKEELENILNGNVELYPHTFMELRNKIQSLLDNYSKNKNSYNKGINLIEHVINDLLPVDCEAAILLTEALICIDGNDDE